MKHKQHMREVGMKILSKVRELIRKVMHGRRLTSGVLVTALAGVLMAAGVAGYSSGSAADMPQDCDDNSIMRCGAANPSDFVAKALDNDPGDLDNVYAHFGLPVSSYSEFANHAKEGTIYRNGDIKVDGETVATAAMTMGRQDFGNDHQLPIGDTTYFFNTPDKRWQDGIQSLPIMVWFDKEGTVKVAIMNPCGNPVPEMKKVKSGAVCKDLIKEPVKGKKDTYKFTTDAHTFGLAKFVKFQYFFDEGNGEQLFATTESPDTPVEKTFTKSATVRVKITISVPGVQQREIVSEECTAEIKVEQKEVPPVKVVKAEVKSAVALPVTGPAGLFGMFTGVSAVGAVGHRLYANYRGRKQK
jgi:hypothetical protein